MSDAAVPLERIADQLGHKDARMPALDEILQPNT
jgi:hypothetical protein